MLTSVFTAPQTPPPRTRWPHPYRRMSLEDLGTKWTRFQLSSTGVPGAAGLSFPPVLERQRSTEGPGAPLQLDASPKQVRPSSGTQTGNWEASEDASAAGEFQAGVCSWLFWGSSGGGSCSRALRPRCQADGTAVSMREPHGAGRCLPSFFPGCLVPGSCRRLSWRRCGLPPIL